VRTDADSSGNADANVTPQNSLNKGKNLKKNPNTGKCEGHKSVENMVRTNSYGGGECGRNGDVGCSRVGGRVEGCSDKGCGVGGSCEGEVRRNKGNERLNDEVRRVVGEILGVCEGTFLDLASVLALRISEDAIPHKSYVGKRE
jgi:hypothetical protein